MRSKLLSAVFFLTAFPILLTAGPCAVNVNLGLVFITEVSLNDPARQEPVVQCTVPDSFYFPFTTFAKPGFSQQYDIFETSPPDDTGHQNFVSDYFDITIAAGAVNLQLTSDTTEGSLAARQGATHADEVDLGRTVLGAGKGFDGVGGALILNNGVGYVVISDTPEPNTWWLLLGGAMISGRKKVLSYR